jgi:hypothetical protein
MQRPSIGTRAWVHLPQMVDAVIVGAVAGWLWTFVPLGLNYMPHELLQLALLPLLPVAGASVTVKWRCQHDNAQIARGVTMGVVAFATCYISTPATGWGLCGMLRWALASMVAQMGLAPAVLFTIKRFGLWKMSRWDREHCAKCGYPTKLLPTNRCPECGTTFEIVEHATRKRAVDPAYPDPCAINVRGVWRRVLYTALASTIIFAAWWPNYPYVLTWLLLERPPKMFCETCGTYFWMAYLQRNPAKLTDALLPYLEARNGALRWRALRLLDYGDEPTQRMVDEVAHYAQYDPDPKIRTWCVSVLSRLSITRLKQLMPTVTQDGDPMVRRRAVVCFATSYDVSDASGAWWLIYGLDDPSVEVSAELYDRLVDRTGETFGFDPTAADAVRCAQLEVWWDWWEATYGGAGTGWMARKR